MNDKLHTLLVQMALSANPTQKQLNDLISGWEIYFDDMRICPDDQQREFDGIIKARLSSGSISIVAPILTSNPDILGHNL